MEKIIFERDRVAALMLQHGMNTSSFGKKIECPPNLVQQWLDGSCRPGVASIEKMCNAFDLSPAYFFVKKNVSVHG